MASLNVLALIPARAGSKGVANKNIKLLGDHPLLSYSIAAAKLSSYINRIIVSTDSEDYGVVAKSYGAEVPFLRPQNLAQDESTDIDFFRHAYNWLKERNYTPDLVVHLRPTTPLRDVSVIDKALAFMTKNPQVTALRSAYKTHLTPYKMFRVTDGFMRPFLSINDVEEFYNLPRQYFEDAFIPNGYVDILRPEILNATDLLHGPNMKLWETSQVPDIDTLDELHAANKLVDDPVFANIVNYLNNPDSLD